MEPVRARAVPDEPGRYWRATFEVAVRDSAFAILTSFHAVEFSQDQAAAANGCTQQSVVKPLRALEDQGLLDRRRGHGKSYVYSLSTTGLRVLESLTLGPSPLVESWVVAVQCCGAPIEDVAARIRKSGSHQAFEAAGGADFIVLFRERQPMETVVSLSRPSNHSAP